MKIGLDARWILAETSGIGVYTRELLRQLLRLDTRNTYRLYFSDRAVMERESDAIGLADAPRASACLLPYGLFSLQSQLDLPRRLRADGLDLFHSPNYLVPLRAFPRRRGGAPPPGRLRCLVTLHDLIPLVFPDYAPRARTRRWFPVYRWLMRQVVARADLVLTVSQASRADIMTHLGVPPDRVRAIPEGVSPRFRPASAPPAADGGARGRAPAILWVGRADPYKNVLGLIESFAALRASLRGPVVLRLAGPRDRRYPEPEQRAAALGVADAVVWLGHLAEDRLLEEYQRAAVFVLPSRYEGFGLPVIEAMACGTPVICSNRGSLPEVAGDAALKVQPEDRVGLTEALRRVLSDPRLADDMRRRGVRQAARFSWETTARQTLESYHRVAGPGASAPTS